MRKDISILIVDDEESMRDFLKMLLKKEGYAVKTSATAEEALELFKKNVFDLVITDIMLGEGLDGVSLLKQVRKISKETIVLLITAFASIETTIEAFREGAWDYILKPFDVNEIKIKINKALEKRQLEIELARLRHELAEKYRYENIIGKNDRMLKIYDLVERVAETDSTVLITGESGTGKDLVARAIHYRSHRKNGPFVSVNCPALPDSLLESELFGHMKGSFTGAVQNKPGLFEQANNGTIMLDEIGEMSHSMQVKLLNVLQNKKFRRVGGDKELSANFRVITATNRDLQEAIKQKKFREDLWYRINVIQIDMPPLRERQDDIPLLAEHFFMKYRDQNKKSIKSISPEVVSALERYYWPGNVRELENVIERSIALETTDKITLASLPEKVASGYRNVAEELEDAGEDGFNLEEHIDNEYRTYLKAALDKANGVHTAAAKLLRVSARSFRYLLEKYNLKK